MAYDAAEKLTTIDYSSIGYYGRPITELSKGDLLAAINELADMYNEVKRKNEKCKEVSVRARFDSS